MTVSEKRSVVSSLLFLSFSYLQIRKAQPLESDVIMGSPLVDPLSSLESSQDGHNNRLKNKNL
ncbi:hypothetical protein OUZ56_000368 [Daphnia magna]|uniref:Uncharacterized protein n=1 Tax=Daphnia magna TaxID=35525 RepID=A0ABQ9ZZH1_9CRUS|nr:hypothetical protein OUZ56_000368 [Daphnia magna]